MSVWPCFIIRIKLVSACRKIIILKQISPMNTSPSSSELKDDNSARRGKPSRGVHFLSRSRLYSYETYLHANEDCWYSRSDELCFKLCARDEELRFMLVTRNTGPINTRGMCTFGMERAIFQVFPNESRRAIVRAVLTDVKISQILSQILASAQELHSHLSATQNGTHVLHVISVLSKLM
jgi:hypothetical protein